MAFPRSFKNQTWFMRLPTGEVELTEKGDLERAFQCGLVDARTPIRAVGASVWTTLGQAAELPRADSVPRVRGPALSAVELPALDLTNGSDWNFRDSGPEPVFQLRGVHSFIGSIMLATVIGLSVLGYGVAHAEATDLASVVAPTDPVVRMDARLVRGLQDARACRELPHHSPRDLARLTRDEQRRLRELDRARRLSGEEQKDELRRAAGKPAVVDYGSTSYDPFASERNPFDL